MVGQDDNFVEGAPIATVSLGCPRALLLEPLGQGGATQIMVQPGSLYILGSKTNKRFKHSIPKAGKRVGPRISIVFRTLDKTAPV